MVASFRAQSGEAVGALRRAAVAPLLAGLDGAGRAEAAAVGDARARLRAALALARAALAAAAHARGEPCDIPGLPGGAPALLTLAPSFSYVLRLSVPPCGAWEHAARARRVGWPVADAELLAAAGRCGGGGGAAAAPAAPGAAAPSLPQLRTALAAASSRLTSSEIALASLRGAARNKVNAAAAMEGEAGSGDGAYAPLAQALAAAEERAAALAALAAAAAAEGARGGGGGEEAHGEEAAEAAADLVEARAAFERCVASGGGGYASAGERLVALAARVAAGEAEVDALRRAKRGAARALERAERRAAGGGGAGGGADGGAGAAPAQPQGVVLTPLWGLSALPPPRRAAELFIRAAAGFGAGSVGALRALFPSFTPSRALAQYMTAAGQRVIVACTGGPVTVTFTPLARAAAAPMRAGAPLSALDAVGGDVEVSFPYQIFTRAEAVRPPLSAPFFAPPALPRPR
jgi:hypothetical protein